MGQQLNTQLTSPFPPRVEVGWLARLERLATLAVVGYRRGRVRYHLDLAQLLPVDLALAGVCTVAPTPLVVGVEENQTGM